MCNYCHVRHIVSLLYSQARSYHSNSLWREGLNFRIVPVSFVSLRIFFDQTFKRPGCEVVFKMAAKGVLRLGQAMLRRTILRPQVLLGIRKGLLWIY